jgi:hypothetical protein
MMNYLMNWGRAVKVPALVTMLVAAPLWLAAMIGGASAYADVVQLTSVNGDYDPNHAQSINVQPGDMITLSADLFNMQNGDTADGSAVEDFVWQADDSTSDVCDASSSEDCLDTSNFEVTDYGVSFYVPYDIGNQITITVTSNDPNVDANSYDQIVLINSNYVAGATLPPVQVITNPADYNRDSFDPDYALAGQGNWVYINGNRYWAPNTYVLAAGEEWVPYQNGYWTFSEGYGYTWVSYDPWGWATDHYGVWRFHEIYGWVWAPFDDRHYEPNCVTFFYDDEHTGWYPYHAEYAAGYRDGYDVGFRDGFGAGENAFDGFGTADYRYHPGFSLVGNSDFNRSNVHAGMLNLGFYANGKETFRNDGELTHVVQGSYQDHNFSELPGGKDLDSSRSFMESRVGSITATRTETIRSSGGAQIMSPTPVHSVPSNYEAIGKAQQANRPRPVGSVFNASSGKPVFVPPTTNGRGIVPPPVVRASNGGKPIVLPPRANHPAVPQSGNPVTSSRPVPKKPVESTPVSGLPTLRGNQPRPSGPAPRPNPMPRPEPTNRPDPTPTYNPAPRPQPTNRPDPTPTYNPAPRPQPTNRPDPTPTYNPAPRPQPTNRPDPTPTYNPAPRPQPTNRPDPTPTYNPAPRPQPTNRPDPTPTYNPAPRPQPTNRPDPTPRPQPTARPAPPVYNPPAPRPAPPVYNPPAPRPAPPVYNPPAPRPAPPVYNPPAPRPAPPVYNPPAPRPAPPVYNPPAPRPDPAPTFGGGGGGRSGGGNDGGGKKK